MSEPARLRPHYLAECDCGWIEEGGLRSRVKRLLEKHAKEHPNTIRRLTRSTVFVWNLPSSEQGGTGGKP